MAKKSSLKSEYKKQIQRITRRFKALEGRGYVFTKTLEQIIKPVKRLTSRTIERLKKITPEELYKQARYIDIESGKFISGLEGRKKERQQAAQKGWKSRRARESEGEDFLDERSLAEIMFSNLESILLIRPDWKQAQKALEALRNFYAKTPARDYIVFMQENGVRLAELAEIIVYTSDRDQITINESLNEFFNILHQGVIPLSAFSDEQDLESFEEY